MKKIILTTLCPRSHRTAEENLGLGYLASSLREKGYDIEIIDAWLTCMNLEQVFNKIISIKQKYDIFFCWNFLLYVKY